jgi:hypothetical protein
MCTIIASMQVVGGPSSVEEHIYSESQERFTSEYVCTLSLSSDFALNEADGQFCGVSSYQRSA